MVKCQTEAQHISTLKVFRTLVCSRLRFVSFVLFFKPYFHRDRECYRIYGSEM